jgi:hypothetical protein
MEFPDRARLEGLDMHARIALESTDWHARQHHYREAGTYVHQGGRRTPRDRQRVSEVS